MGVGVDRVGGREGSFVSSVLAGCVFTRMLCMPPSRRTGLCTTSETRTELSVLFTRPLAFEVLKHSC